MRTSKSIMTLVAFFLFELIILTKIQSRLAVPLFDDNIALVLGGGIFALLCIISANGKFSKKVISLFGILVCYAFIFTFLLKNEAVSTYINNYFLAFSGFLLIVISVVGFYKNRTTVEIWTLIKYTYLTVVLFLLVCYIVYFDDFVVLRNPMLLFESSWKRQRSSFGFVHANTTAGICLICFYLRFLLLTGKKNNYFEIGKYEFGFVKYSIILVLIMLISTASRGTIVAVMALYFFKWYFDFDERFSNKISIKIIKPVLVMGLLILVFIEIYNLFIVSGSFDISYRMQNFTDNIPTLIREDRIWVGLGFMDKAMFAKEKLIVGTGYTDNFFLYILVSTGIVGICFVIAFIFNLLRGFHYIKNATNDVYIYRVILSIFLSQMVLSISEAEFLNPASPNAMICLIIYGLYYICGLYGKEISIKE